MRADFATTTQRGPDPIKIYIAYAEKDERFKEDLETHLALLVRQQIISPWYSRQIGLGREKDREFDNQIMKAQIILLLVSPAFMASNYAYEQEMMRALQHHAADQARVVPVLLRPTTWENAPFSNLQELPRNRKPISAWKDADEAWVEIARELRGLCEELQKNPPKGASDTFAQHPTEPNRPEKEQVMPSTSSNFDVFLSYNRKDGADVKEIAAQLQAEGISVWLDEWEAQPGRPWQLLLDQAISTSKSAAIFIGSNGLGDWQIMELEKFMRESVSRGCPVIPVLLKTAPSNPALPLFLDRMTWVNFHKPEPDPIKQLIWGITNKKPGTAANQPPPPPSTPTQAASSLSFGKKRELVNLLLACSCMGSQDSRQTVLKFLNEQLAGVKDRIPERSDNIMHVTEIVTTCQKYPQGLRELIGIVAFFEGDSVNAQHLNTFLEDNSL